MVPIACSALAQISTRFDVRLPMSAVISLAIEIRCRQPPSLLCVEAAFFSSRGVRRDFFFFLGAPLVSPSYRCSPSVVGCWRICASVRICSLFRHPFSSSPPSFTPFDSTPPNQQKCRRKQRQAHSTCAVRSPVGPWVSSKVLLCFSFLLLQGTPRCPRPFRSIPCAAGDIPPELGQLSKLQHLALCNNRLSGASVCHVSVDGCAYA